MRIILASAVIGTALAFGSPVYAAEPLSKVVGCEAYAYTGGAGGFCADFPGTADRNCPEIGFQVTLVKGADVDPWDLDKDGDGKGCDAEGMPIKPIPSTTPSPKPTVTSKPPTQSPKPSPSVTRSSRPVPNPEPETEELPLTGPSPWVFGGVGLAAVTLGGLGAYLSRRRQSFEA